MQERVRDPEEKASFAGTVYLKTGFFSAVRAVLARSGDELILATANREVFRVPLTFVEKVEFPWWWFGGGMRVTVGGMCHTLSFSAPRTVEGEDSDWLRHVGGGLYGSEQALRQAASARRSSKEWKAALTDVGYG